MQTTYEAPEHGFAVISGAHSPATLDRLVAMIRKHAETYPFEHPTMWDGTPLSVRVTSFGDRGWWAGFSGARYIERHPTTNKPWPAMPAFIRSLSIPYIGDTQAFRNDTALVNWYAADASLGWHVDRTEADKVSPIVTLSLGASAIFEIRLGGQVHRVTLNSGDGVVMAGASRNAEHRIVRLLRPFEMANASQANLFGAGSVPPLIHDPLGDGTRMSITWRRTGLQTGGKPCA